jgi:hypothetical protein
MRKQSVDRARVGFRFMKIGGLREANAGVIDF